MEAKLSSLLPGSSGKQTEEDRAPASGFRDIKINPDCKSVNVQCRVFSGQLNIHLCLSGLLPLKSVAPV